MGARGAFPQTAGTGQLPLARGRVPGLENTLFCQFSSNEVESVLSPEDFAVDDVGRRPEDPALDRFLRVGRVALAHRGRAGGQRLRIEAYAPRQRREGLAVG